jgi:hypothetical protein
MRVVGAAGTATADRKNARLSCLPASILEKSKMSLLGAAAGGRVRPDSHRVATDAPLVRAGATTMPVPALSRV